MRFLGRSRCLDGRRGCFGFRCDIGLLATGALGLGGGFFSNRRLGRGRFRRSGISLDLRLGATTTAGLGWRLLGNDLYRSFGCNLGRRVLGDGFGRRRAVGLGLAGAGATTGLGRFLGGRFLDRSLLGHGVFGDRCVLGHRLGGFRVRIGCRFTAFTTTATATATTAATTTGSAFFLGFDGSDGGFRLAITILVRFIGARFLCLTGDIRSFALDAIFIALAATTATAATATAVAIAILAPVAPFGTVALGGGLFLFLGLRLFFFLVSTCTMTRLCARTYDCTHTRAQPRAQTYTHTHTHATRTPR